MRKSLLLVGLLVASALNGACFTYMAQDGSGRWDCEELAKAPYVNPEWAAAMPGYYACVRAGQDAFGNWTIHEVRVVNQPF